MGFIENYDERGEKQKVTNDYIHNGDYEVDIAGIRWVYYLTVKALNLILQSIFRFPAKVNIHSPNLPTKFPDKEREAYQATRDKTDDFSVVTIKQ